MRKFIYKIMLANFLFPLLGTFILAGIMNIEKDNGYFIVTKIDSISVKGVPNVELDNITGDLDVIGGFDKIILTQKIRILTLSENKALKLAKNYNAVIDKKGSTVNIVGRDDIKKVSIRYTLKVPKVSNVKVKAAGSDVTLTKLNGTIDVNTSGGDIELDELSGEIYVRTSGGDIYVRDSFGNIELLTSGGDIETENIDGNIYLHTSGGDILCKKTNGDMKASTSGGDITLKYFKGKRVEARTSGGDIIGNDLFADVELKTSGGDIEIDGRLESATLRTSGGDIYIDSISDYGEVITSGGDIVVNHSPGDLYLQTSGGDIQVNNNKGSIEARTSGGDIEVSKIPDESGKIKPGKVITSGGDITLRIMPNSFVTIKAETKVRKRYKDEYGIYSDFPINLSEESHGYYVIKRGTVLLNGGGNILELQTSHGDIIIKEF